MRIHYRHVRHPFNDSKFIATVCVIEAEDGTMTTSFAQCNPKDIFNKATGRRIAYSRALQGFTPKEVPYKAYTPDGRRTRLYPVADVLLGMVYEVYAGKQEVTNA